MVNKLTGIRCPGKKRHNKRRGDMVVAEECCNTLLGFVNTSVSDTEVAYKCRDCKRIIYTVVRSGIAFVKVYDKDTKIKLDTGKVVVE